MLFNDFHVVPEARMLYGTASDQVSGSASLRLVGLFHFRDLALPNTFTSDLRSRNMDADMKAEDVLAS